MKTAVLMAIAAVTGMTAWAGNTEPRRVSVCMNSAGQVAVAEQAQMIASKMFARIGVKLDWGNGRFCQTAPDQAIVVILSTQTPRTLLPGALAYALPYEGTHIEVFYDRMSHASDALVPHILAHVLAHEITHILQGTNVHADSGIMKARWNHDDLERMEQKPFTFTKEDVILLHNGFAARVSRRAPGTLAAANLVP